MGERDKSIFHAVALETADLVLSKQAAYGDSFGQSGKVLQLLYPHGIKHAQLGDALTITRIVDKLFRISHQKDAFGESPWDDILGYSLLAAVRDARGRPRPTPAAPPTPPPVSVKKFEELVRKIDRSSSNKNEREPTVVVNLDDSMDDH